MENADIGLPRSLNFRLLWIVAPPTTQMEAGAGVVVPFVRFNDGPICHSQDVFRKVVGVCP
jgi:hypothetical protein